MKKILKCVLTLLIGVSIVACGGDKKKEQVIEWGKDNKLADLVSYQIETIGRTQQITPDVIGTYYTYYKPKTTTNVLLNVALQMKNLTKEDLKLSTTLGGTFTIDEKEYKASTILTSQDGKSISQGGTVKANETSKVYFYTEIDPTILSKDISFKLASKDEKKEDSASMTFKLSDIDSHYESKKLKDVIKFDGSGEITLQSTNVASKIEPKKPTGLYTYYKVQSSANNFVILSTKVKNTTDKEMPASNIATARLIDKNNNEYPCNMIYEKDNQSNLATASSTKLKAGQSGTVHYVFEVSSSIAKGDKTVRFTHLGKVYTVKL